MASEEITKDIIVAWLSNPEIVKKGSSPLAGNDPQETGDYIATVSAIGAGGSSRSTALTFTR